MLCDKQQSETGAIGMSAEEKLQNYSNKDTVAKNNNALMDGFLVAAKSLEKCGSDKSATIGDDVVCSSFKVDEEKKRKSNQRNYCIYLKQTGVLLWTERVILILVCFAIAAGFTAPIIIYATDTDRGDNSTLSIDIDVDSCQTLNSMSSDTKVC